MEVTQFTYFQQVGGFDCRPGTRGDHLRGIERLAMYIQGVDSVYDLVWVERPDGTTYTYGDVFKRNEFEYSRHNFELADTAMLYGLFDTYEAECLPRPRRRHGAPCLRLRAQVLARVQSARRARRDRGRRACELHRPGAGASPRRAASPTWPRIITCRGDRCRQSSDAPLRKGVRLCMQARARLRDRGRGDPLGALVRSYHAACRRCRERALDEARLAYGVIDVYGSPRRLVLRVSDLAEAAGGSAPCGRRVRPSRSPLMRTATPPKPPRVRAQAGGRRRRPRARRATRPASTCTRSSSRPGAPCGRGAARHSRYASSPVIDWPKSMRWGSGRPGSSRPRSLDVLALFGTDVVPVEFVGSRCRPRRTYLRPPLPFTRSASRSRNAADRYPMSVRAWARGVRSRRASRTRIREGIDVIAADSRLEPVVSSREGLRRGGEPRRVAHRWRSGDSMRSSSRCRARSSRPRCSPPALLPARRPRRDAAADAFVVVHNGDPERTETDHRGTRARHPRPPGGCGILLPRGPRATRLEGVSSPIFERITSSRRSSARSAPRSLDIEKLLPPRSPELAGVDAGSARPPRLRVRRILPRRT
jgi:hypothetical protein